MLGRELAAVAEEVLLGFGFLEIDDEATLEAELNDLRPTLFGVLLEPFNDLFTDD